MTVQMRAELDPYTTKVLGVIKERFGLKDKSAALNKLVHMYGEEFVPKEMSDKAFSELISVCQEHAKKYGTKKMSLAELDSLVK